MSTIDLPTAGAPLTQLTEDEEAFREAVRTFARNEVAPLVQQMDAAQEMDPQLIRQLFEMGLMGVDVPEAFGGAETSFFSAVLVVEELSRTDPSVGVLVDVQNTLVNNAILRWGSEALKEKYLPRLCSELVGAYALSEAGSGSDAFALATRAVEAAPAQTQIERIDPNSRADEPNAFATSIGFSIEATGAYEKTALFMAAIENDLGFSTVDSFSLSPQESPGGEMVHAMIDTSHRRFDPSALTIAAVDEEGDE